MASDYVRPPRMRCCSWSASLVLSQRHLQPQGRGCLFPVQVTGIAEAGGGQGEMWVPGHPQSFQSVPLSHFTSSSSSFTLRDFRPRLTHRRPSFIGFLTNAHDRKFQSRNKSLLLMRPPFYSSAQTLRQGPGWSNSYCRGPGHCPEAEQQKLWRVSHEQ